MDFIHQQVDRVLRIYGEPRDVALADVLIEFPWAISKREVLYHAELIAKKAAPKADQEMVRAIAAWTTRG